MNKDTVKYARISLTPNCHLRCRYCRPRPRDLTKEPDNLVGFEKLNRVIKIFKSLGIQKYRFTGGEPFIRKGVFEFLSGVELENYFVTSSLHFSGEKIPLINSMASGGLSGVNVSLDSLNPHKYRHLTGGDVELVKENLRNLRVDNLKLNTILIKDFNTEEAEDIINFGVSLGADVRFIEKMDLIDDGLKSDSVEGFRKKLIDDGLIHPKSYRLKNSVSIYHNLKNKPGKVGFITPFEAPFCHRCDKIRITSSGKLKRCLFEAGGIDLNAMLNLNGDLLKEKLKTILNGKIKKRVVNHSTVNMGCIGG